MLRHRYVPVLVDIQALASEGPRDRDAEDFLRIRAEAAADGLGRSPGELSRLMGLEAHVASGVEPFYALVLDPEGRPVQFLGHLAVSRAGRKPSVARLTALAERLGALPGAPLPPFRLRGEDASLHVSCRYTDDSSLTRLDSTVIHRRAFKFPGEAVVKLERPMSFAPPPSARPGDSWKIDPAVAKSILVHFYPPTEASPVRANVLIHESLGATYEGRRGDVTFVRLHGSMHLKHPWWNAPDNNRIKAGLSGYVAIDVRTGRIETFRLITDGAIYYLSSGARAPFAVAVVSR